MELEFSKTSLPWARKILEQVKEQEQTLELRLPDGMPDVRKVLGCWGQVLIRGKEWEKDSVGVNAGVMVWALYLGEEGDGPQCAEAWIPFQTRFEIPQSQRDGAIQVNASLRMADARTLSSRKLMLRACVSVGVCAYVPGEQLLWEPENVPEDVRLLTNTYPMKLPAEAGEKLFSMDEELTLPDSAPRPEKLLYYTLRPQVEDQNILAGRIVFRGSACLHVLYQDGAGKLAVWDAEIPFSQYHDLEREYEDGQAWISPVVTSLELEREDGRLRLKAGLAGQYVIYFRPMVRLVEDAYSPCRQVRTETEEVQLPAVLDETEGVFHAEQTLPENAVAVVDTVFYPEQPAADREQDGLRVRMGGRFSVLYYDEDGELNSDQRKWEAREAYPASGDCGVSLCAQLREAPQSGGGRVSAELGLRMRFCSRQTLHGVCGLNMTEAAEPDPNRPSLILRRPGKQSLWELAKNCGSTVDAIRDANGLEADPVPDRLLLIPIP